MTQSMGGDDKPRSIKVRRRTTQPQELLYGITTNSENQKNEDQNQNQNHNHPLTRVPSAPGSLKFVFLMFIILFKLFRLSFANLRFNLFAKYKICSVFCYIASFICQTHWEAQYSELLQQTKKICFMSTRTRKNENFLYHGLKFFYILAFIHHSFFCCTTRNSENSLSSRSLSGSQS